VRLVSIGVGLLGMAPVLMWLEEGYVDGDLWEMTYYGPQIVFALVLVLIGAIGFFGAGLLVRWSTPVRSEVRCPKCRYELLSATETQCPECGMDVSSLWGTGGSAVSDRAWRARAVSNVTVGLRLIGFVGGVYCLLHFMWSLVWITYMYDDDWKHGLLVIMWPILMCAASVALIFFGSYLAGRVVPTQKAAPLSPSAPTDGGDA
jgi:hypothetical protein